MPNVIRIENGNAYTCDEKGIVPPQCADMRYAVITETQNVSTLLALFSDPRDAANYAEAIVSDPNRRTDSFAEHKDSIYEETPFIADALAND